MLSDTQTKIKSINVWREAPDIFGIELGNRWAYQGTYSGGVYTAGAAVIAIDSTTFPTTTHIIEHEVNQSVVGREWYEKTSSELRLWGEDFGDFYGFSNGLLFAWHPMKVNDQKYSSATVRIQGYDLNISLTVDALAKDFIDLGFDTLEAFLLRYVIRIWGHGIDQSSTWYRWVVPYVGTVIYQDDELGELITDFAIANGTITPTTDFDEDGLKDYEELIVSETDWQQPDTDHDQMPDGWEVAYGLDPQSDDAAQDADGDGVINIIECRRGTDPSDPGDYPSFAQPWLPLLLLDD